MYKAPSDRVKTLQDALSQDLRNFPLVEPDKQLARALAQAIENVATGARGRGDTRAGQRRAWPRN